jgi:hypothetical protein
MNVWLKLLLAVLATWRVTHLLASEDGPADVMVRLRRKLGDGFAGALMDCFHCLSLWVAAPAALFVAREPLEVFVTWLALSGGACLLERTGQAHAALAPLSRPAEGGLDHGMLWPETSAAPPPAVAGEHDPDSR